MDARSPERGPRPPVAPSEWVAAGGLVALGTAFVLSPAGVQDGAVICPFRRVTGLPCPGCGLTRSWVDLAHGDLAGAWAMNPFGIVLVAALAVLVVLVVRARLRGDAPPRLDAWLRRPAVLVVLAGWLVFGLARMAA
ncbi:DUF2752 domain-containing protein [Nocardioides dongxiaopingii]|uniref:DUF2752 domain-containing protein n=1 Tax=Nocardioides dongxiaopingii TaxID=2576036 RepID=UPI0010C7625D|nr:DUF2752 domain-containing protein [Nocardioides dongxiaopingii]